MKTKRFVYDTAGMCFLIEACSQTYSMQRDIVLQKAMICFQDSLALDEENFVAKQNMAKCLLY